MIWASKNLLAFEIFTLNIFKNLYFFGFFEFLTLHSFPMYLNPLNMNPASKITYNMNFFKKRDSKVSQKQDFKKCTPTFFKDLNFFGFYEFLTLYSFPMYFDQLNMNLTSEITYNMNFLRRLMFEISKNNRFNIKL